MLVTRQWSVERLGEWLHTATNTPSTSLGTGAALTRTPAVITAVMMLRKRIVLLAIFVS
jgi:hypothetical protein